VVNTGNVFIDHIYKYKRSKHKFLYRIKTYFFLKKLKYITPDFFLLWDISILLKTLQLIYLYPNSVEDRIHTYHNKKQKDNETSFAVNVDSCEIVFTLDKDIKGIEIKTYMKVNKTIELKNSIYFIDGEADVSDIHNEQLFINIIDWLMDSVSDLVKKYTQD